MRMGSLLSGNALKIYAALSPETTDDYASLKAALLSGFNIRHLSLIEMILDQLR